MGNQRENKFTEDSVVQEALFMNAFSNSPLGLNDELGNHLGQSNISQVRYFETPYDMTELLMLNNLYGEFVRSWESRDYY